MSSLILNPYEDQEYKTHLLDVIAEDDADRPRTLQKRIGPSGIGHPCHFCLGCMLAMVPKADDNKWADCWPAFVGTAVHKQLEKVYQRQNRRLGTTRYLTELNVTAGIIGDWDLTGSCDLFDPVTGKVTDFKVQGDKPISKFARDGISQIYKVQMHTYGLGMTLAGHTVTKAGLLILAKSKNFLQDAVYYAEPWDWTIAEGAIRRADTIQRAGDADGWGYVLPRLKHLDGCWDCGKYAAGVQALALAA
jgi:hypothetical protein